MKKSFIIIAAAVIALAGCRNQDQNLPPDVEIPVSVEDIRLKPIEEFVSTTGTAIPKGEITLKAKIVASYFLEINPQTGRAWQLGDRVKAGSLIARLEDKEFVNSVRLESYQLNLELSESEMKKQESLYEKGGVTLKDMKTSAYNYTNAKSNLENAQLQMEKTRITSPISGVIVELPYYTQGTQVEAGSQVVKIMDYQTMFMNVQLPEKYINTIKPGQTVNLTNYALPEDTLTGKITQLSPAINADTRTFLGNIQISNPDYLLRPGMFVKADIVTNHKDTVIVIPKSIILSRQKGKTVFIIDRGVAAERVIETGLENVSEVEVTRGLAKNERIVTTGYETLSNKSKVKIVK
jgi:membrane fusion protein (multidrug efflux system)